MPAVTRAYIKPSNTDLNVADQLTLYQIAPCKRARL